MSQKKKLPLNLSQKEYWREKDGTEFGICPECYKKSLADKRAKENEVAAEKTAELELPELTGSEKQVAWANQLRLNFITNVEKLVEDLSSRQEYLECLDIKLNEIYNLRDWTIKNKNEAKFYIDNRDINTVKVLISIKTEISKIVEKPIEEDEAIDEATVYPENESLATPSEIKSTESEIILKSEKNDKIIEIAKSLGYKWSNGSWRREILSTDSVVDRIAELGNKLLSKGYPIRILDNSAREKAINGTFELEHYNWIMKRSSGNYEGWFAIKWNGRSDKLYNAARKIKGSKWDGGCVVVPTTNYKEVVEFADLLDFKFTKTGQEIYDKAKNAHESAKRVSPVDAPERIDKDGLKEILESGSEVIDDLKD
jgi:hypothetical protein